MPWVHAFLLVVIALARVKSAYFLIKVAWWSESAMLLLPLLEPVHS
jgi:hypothetical protein